MRQQAAQALRAQVIKVPEIQEEIVRVPKITYEERLVRQPIVRTLERLVEVPVDDVTYEDVEVDVVQYRHVPRGQCG